MTGKNNKLKWTMGSISGIAIFVAGMWFAFDGRVRNVESKTAVLENQSQRRDTDIREIKQDVKDIKQFLMERSEK